MRIIGGRDYYDTALAYGIDEKVVFVRNHDELEKNSDLLHTPLLRYIAVGAYPLKNPRTSRWWQARCSFEDKNGIEYGVRYVTVIMAGKAYIGVGVSQEKSSIETVETFYWTKSKFDAFLDEHGQARRTKSDWQRNYNPNEFKEVQLHQEAIDWLIARNVTIMILDSDIGADLTVCINSDRLKDYEFYQRVDAWSAMQEISMWVSGVLPSSARPMVQIADKDKIAKHGFDKWSFRKKVR